MPDVVYATADTWVTEFLYTRRGEMFYATDPAVVAHPASFQSEPPPDRIRRTDNSPDFDQTVEQATANPGETRKTKRGGRD